MSELMRWREVIKPHHDVAHGKFKNAEFSADLESVYHGEGSVEYQDAEQFFRRTYATTGLKDLLKQVLKRICGRDGDPVIQLKTSFGGGKTHSMLALYHLMTCRLPIEKLSSIGDVLRELKLSSIPRVKTAVIVGTSESLTNPEEINGIYANTLWGKIAAQLGSYEQIRKDDINHVSPGTLALKKMFDECGPCVILIDELTAYARKLYDNGKNENLICGTYENFLTFIQELTEAAKSSINSLVVATLPVSEHEAGGKSGIKILNDVEQHFGRLVTILNPVEAKEGFEIVRMRLFSDDIDVKARDDTAEKFSRMYIENADKFPVEAREEEYKQRIISCYPIHPELFDRLYESWAVLEKFQRTRGVLRFLASLIYYLWNHEDSSPLIMPGSILFENPNVREELIRSLPEKDVWYSIIDNEVDGEKSIPSLLDRNERFNLYSASKKISRSIMFGTAPEGREQTVRGIELSRIRLGSIKPGDNIAAFDDALNELQKKLTHLYTNMMDNRYWFDTRPTLRKTVEARAKNIDKTAIKNEILGRLRILFKNVKPFSGVNFFSDSLDVPDEKEMRLVIVDYDGDYESKAREILNNHGNNIREYKNTIVFIFPDNEQLNALKEEIRYFLAWKSIKDDKNKPDMNLDRVQTKEVENNISLCENNVSEKMKDTWIILAVPEIPNEEKLSEIELRKTTINWDQNIIDSIKSCGNLISEWAPEPMLMDIDRLFNVNGDIVINDLWENLCKFCYLPKVFDYGVLERAIKRGVQESWFGVADGKNIYGEYENLIFGEVVNVLNKDSYLIKKEFIVRKTDNDELIPEEEITTQSEQHNDITAKPEKKSSKKTKFELSTRLNAEQLSRKAKELYEEVIVHLLKVGDVKVNIDVEVEARYEIPEEIVDIVKDNCKSLNVNYSKFS